MMEVSSVASSCGASQVEAGLRSTLQHPVLHEDSVSGVQPTNKRTCSCCHDCTAAVELAPPRSLPGKVSLNFDAAPTYPTLQPTSHENAPFLLRSNQTAALLEVLILQ